MMKTIDVLAIFFPLFRSVVFLYAEKKRKNTAKETKKKRKLARTRVGRPETLGFSYQHSDHCKRKGLPQ
jgi:hypothetical protein